MRKKLCLLAVLVLTTGLWAEVLSPTGPKARQGGRQDTLPVTTSSEEARKLYDAGIESWENLQVDWALKRWRTAVNIDPDFALAHLLLSYCTPDPAEETAEREKAKSLADKVTPAERRLIVWLAGVREGNYVAGIAAMNDLLARYPQDKQLLAWAGSWLFHQQEYERAQKRFEQAVAIDPDFAVALNDLGYIYAYQGDYDRAFRVMQHYVSLLPQEPNPQDSYAEILRMAGRYQEAIEHYRTALRLDPNFHSAQLGIADTYSLMGEQRKARQEYFRARVLATDRLTELQDLMQSAFTYVRERDALGADYAFEEVVQQAHRAGLPLLGAEAWRMRARLQFIGQPDDLVRSEAPEADGGFLFFHKKPGPMPEDEYLDNAEQVLAAARTISESDRQDERARILSERAQAAGRHGLFLRAEETLGQLEAMAKVTPSAAVQHALERARGAVLVYEGKYDQAIPVLERNRDDAFSLFRLAYAAEKSGKVQLAQEHLRQVERFNEPTPEQAFLVPILRFAKDSVARVEPRTP